MDLELQMTYSLKVLPFIFKKRYNHYARCHLDSPRQSPLWFLAYLLLHVVIGLGLFGTNTDCPVATVMAGRVRLVHLRPSLLVNGNQYHA